MRGRMLYESIYMRCPEQTSPQQVELRLQGVSACSGSRNTVAQTGGGVVVAVLKQQKCIVCQIWRPEVREQVSNRLVSFRRPLLGFSMVLFLPLCVSMS